MDMRKRIFIIMLLVATVAQAQITFNAKRCVHAMEGLSYMPTHDHNGMMRSNSTSTTDGLGSYGKSANGLIKSIGSPTIPVLMVDFPDVKFNEVTTMEKVSRIFNEEGYADEPNCRGSVRDYYRDNSGGLFSPSFEVIGQVSVSKECEYYGANSSTSHYIRIKDFVKEAIAVAQEAGIDFSKYVEGTTVPMVIFYFAGPGENSCPHEDAFGEVDHSYEKYIWPHFNDYAFTSGGISFSSYYVGSEWRYSYKISDEGKYVPASGSSDGIGILIHEFMHSLGMPDFYPTNGGFYETPDWWSVMDYGEYYANAYRPVGMTAYERSYLGWLDIKELGNEEEAVTLGPGEAAVVRNQANTNEYYVIENRQPGTWYPDKYGSGLLVMHVDYLSSVWLNNRLNNDKNHLRMKVKWADGVWTGSSLPSPLNWEDMRRDLYGYAEDLPTSITDWAPYTAGTVNPVYDIRIDDDGQAVFSYITEGISTGVGAVVATTTGSADAYALDGRCVSHPTKGLYIMNGKKVVVK